MGIFRRAARRPVTDTEDQFHQPGTLKGNADSVTFEHGHTTYTAGRQTSRHRH